MPARSGDLFEVFTQVLRLPHTVLPDGLPDLFHRSALEEAPMKKLFLLMALILTLAQFNVIAHGAGAAQLTSGTTAQCTGCASDN